MTPSRTSPDRAERRRKLRSVASVFGVHVATEPVCRGHHAPMDFLEAWCYDRPPVSAVLGPRGGGKSFLASFATFWDSVAYPGHGTRILGGSLAQSQQIYEAIARLLAIPEGRARLRSVTKTAATFANGSDVSMLAASTTSVRGPHVPTLRLDEIDEIDLDIREAAMGMCMARGGVPASVSMTSTWHRVGGPMTALVDRAKAGEYPFFTFCAFEVLERCPEERSGPGLENCPSCPIVKWCHATDGPPKAKRSDGHYAIDSLVQKVRTVSPRVFEADYLCAGPKPDGVWFTLFDESNVSADAEYDPRLPVHLSIDSGVCTGAVFFQVGAGTHGNRRVNVFADYFSEGVAAESSARELLALSRSLCSGRHDRVTTDSAGGARNPIGPTVLQEYRRAGLVGRNGLECWPVGSVADSLALLESLVRSADGTTSLRVHPRCVHTVAAMRAYRRAKRQGQWQDYPEDPQHPAEDLVDALRGGLRVEFPEGRKPAPKFAWTNSRNLL